MKRWRRAIGCCAAVAVVVGFLALPAERASADPVLNEAAKYVINVPGDVLAGSADTMTEAAQLAAGQTFDWEFVESQFSQVSGAFTATPADPATVLSASDLATFSADAASFAAPAITATRVLKVVGTASLPLLAFDIGTKIGSAGARAFGFTDDQVCEQRDTALTVMAGVLDGVDCSGFNNALANTQRNLDAHKPLYPDTCIPGVGCWTFTNQVALGNGILYNVFKGPCVSENALYAVKGTTDADLDHLTSFSPYGCPSMEFSSSVKPAVTAFKLAVVGTTVTSPLEVVHDSGSNPQRDWECTVTTMTGQVYEKDSPSWREADAIVAPVLCPGVPAGQLAGSMQIVEHGGGADQVVWNGSTSGAYREWLSKYPECANGSCPLLLHQLGQSCFLVGIGCDGWIDDPQREKNYSCTWGTHPIPLDECFVYGNNFNPASQANGFVYSNPQTGAAVAVPTGPTNAQRLIKDWINRISTKKFAALPTADRAAYLATAAALCLANHPLSVCQKDALWFPGNDIPEVARHDAEAILVGQPFELTAMTGLAKSASGVKPGWYDSPKYAGGLCYGKAPAGYHCDEYPYYSTLQGGPAGPANPLDGDLRYVLAGQNTSEGAQRNAFYSRCGLTSAAGSAQNFIVVPDQTAFPTFGLCAP